MNLKKYLSLIRSGILESLQFRLSTLITILYSTHCILSKPDILKTE
jgi:hypothetical protein